VDVDSTVYPPDGGPEPSGALASDRVAPAQPLMNPLQRLIHQCLRDRGRSYGDIARGGGLPRSTIDALAQGLDVPVSVVRAAAAESAGLHYYDETTPEQGRAGGQQRDLLIASIDELSPEDQRHVAALVESLRNKGAVKRTAR